jgi:hypothetical protein
MPAKRKDLAGKKFGMVTAIRPEFKTTKGAWHWLCQCDCGTTFTTCGSRLSLSRTKSCGCNQWRNVTKHNQTRSPTWISWLAMRRRCDDPSSNRYHAYGAVGITYCEKWKDFIGFLDDMGERPVGMSLDRINGTLGYSKENCRWASDVTQSRNRSVVRLFQLNGSQMTLGDLAKIAGVSVTTMRRRIVGAGMSPADAVRAPVNRKQQLNAFEQRYTKRAEMNLR